MMMMMMVTISMKITLRQRHSEDADHHRWIVLCLNDHIHTHHGPVQKRLVAVWPHLGLLRLSLSPNKWPISRVLLLMIKGDSRLRMVEISVSWGVVLGLLLTLPKSTSLILSLIVVVCARGNSLTGSWTMSLKPHSCILILRKHRIKRLKTSHKTKANLTRQKLLWTWFNTSMKFFSELVFCLACEVSLFSDFENYNNKFFNNDTLYAKPWYLVY